MDVQSLGLLFNSMILISPINWSVEIVVICPVLVRSVKVLVLLCRIFVDTSLLSNLLTCLQLILLFAVPIHPFAVFCPAIFWFEMVLKGAFNLEFVVQVDMSGIMK